MENELSLDEIIQKNRKELFSEIEEYLDMPEVTDIEWDGMNLWITELGKGCQRLDKKLSSSFINNLSLRLSNIMKVSFNKAYPVLEAHTEDLRISIFHESRSGEKSVTIRKTPALLRYDHEKLIEDNTMPEPLLNLLENCVKAHCNIVIGGQPHAGKTELLKYCSSFIPQNEKVITLEDNAEIHYRQLYPNRKHTPFIVDDKFTYSMTISKCIRHNSDWLLLSESRGPEVVELLNALSTGNYCMTTMHVNRVKDIPDRMYNMLGTSGDAKRFIDNIYNYINVGLIIKADKQENRTVTELGFFDRAEKNGIYKNIYIPFYDILDGMKMENKFPDKIKRAFEEAGIADPFARPDTPMDCLG